MATCTIFKNFGTFLENKSIINVSNMIASDQFKSEIEAIQLQISKGDSKEANRLKSKLLAFTPSATFTDKRLVENIQNHSGFIHLDFDKITPDKLEEAFIIISKIPETFLCFRSPSGNGLKVFVEVKIRIEQHAFAYEKVMRFYEEKTGLKADEKCKDITRLCFMSYDPKLYKNLSNKIFETTFSNPPEKIKDLFEKELGHLNALHFTEKFNECVSFTELKKTYINGSRNEFIYVLASNCNRRGIPINIAIELTIDRYDLPNNEIGASFKSAYKHHSNEFAKFANDTNLQNVKNENNNLSDEKDEEDCLEDYLKTTPTIPDEIFEKLPFILREGSSAFKDKRKRDVFLVSAISILSGCLQDVYGIYSQERVSAHLYTFIVAPPASGKGVMKNAKRLADKFHEKILQQSREAQRNYEIELAAYKLQERKNKNVDTNRDRPIPPKFKIVFIPADCSKARMIEHLDANDAQGIICESEADTMSGSKKQDWGDYSPILRAAFHHEKISLTRKTNNEYIEIDEPRLAVNITGTPGQVPKLIGSSEDGLFSRFLYYVFKGEIFWNDPSPKKDEVVYNDHFEMLSIEVLNMVEFLEQSKTTFELTNSQWEIINTEFPIMLSEIVIFTGEDAKSVIYRMGLILFRICMVFTTLRKFENAEFVEKVVCSDEDFNTAKIIVKTLVKHSILMFNNLPKQNETNQFYSGDSKRKFFEALPQEFKRKDAILIASRFSLSARTADEVLRLSIGVTLTKIKGGVYKKL